MSEAEIVAVVHAMADAAVRAVKADVDVIEIHAAHGYLIHQFLSPVTNRRRDQYGGSLENNIRMLVDIIKAIRSAIPADTPLFVRLSSTDWMEKTAAGRKYGSWDVASSIHLAKMLPKLGIDLLDVSSRGLASQAAFTLFDAGYRNAQKAAQIRDEVLASGQMLLFGTVGQITDAKQARDLVQQDSTGTGAPAVGIVSLGREFLRQSGWVLMAAHELGVKIAWPVQHLKAAM
jgi:2,4-dienoyl-CoA reductase-like NADH-dependent reductase (Old Yellow Enzyme family)